MTRIRHHPGGLCPDPVGVPGPVGPDRYNDLPEGVGAEVDRPEISPARAAGHRLARPEPGQQARPDQRGLAGTRQADDEQESLVPSRPSSASFVTAPLTNSQRPT